MDRKSAEEIIILPPRARWAIVLRPENWAGAQPQGRAPRLAGEAAQEGSGKPRGRSFGVRCGFVGQGRPACGGQESPPGARLAEDGQVSQMWGKSVKGLSQARDTGKCAQEQVFFRKDVRPASGVILGCTGNRTMRETACALKKKKSGKCSVKEAISGIFSGEEKKLLPLPLAKRPEIKGLTGAGAKNSPGGAWQREFWHVCCFWEKGD